jgi:hypothetical protein
MTSHPGISLLDILRERRGKYMVFERLNFRQKGQIESKKNPTYLVDNLKEIN